MKTLHCPGIISMHFAMSGIMPQTFLILVLKNFFILFIPLGIISHSVTRSDFYYGLVILKEEYALFLNYIKTTES